VNELELLAHLRETADPAAWAVYADLLQSRDDVRGELVALALAGNEAAEASLRAKHRDELGPPPFWDALEQRRLIARWAFGHVVELDVLDPKDRGAALGSRYGRAHQERQRCLDHG
jgi:hypothetical protein